jgi:hypothetical protein
MFEERSWLRFLAMLGTAIEIMYIDTSYNAAYNTVLYDVMLFY